jgi:hypothetical protein
VLFGGSSACGSLSEALLQALNAQGLKDSLALWAASMAVFASFQWSNKNECSMGINSSSHGRCSSIRKHSRCINMTPYDTRRQHSRRLVTARTVDSFSAFSSSHSITATRALSRDQQVGLHNNIGHTRRYHYLANVCRFLPTISNESDNLAYSSTTVKSATQLVQFSRVVAGAKMMG